MGDQLQSAILSCNKVAMAHFRLRRLRPSQHLLHRAFALLPLITHEPLREKLRVMTLNNLGCLYSLAKPEVAVRHLEEALDLELRAEERVQAAGTCLNLSAIRAQLGQHEEALRQACMALELLTAQGKKTAGGDVALAVAFHNVGVEYEVLSKPGEAAKAYKQGLREAKNRLGKQHEVTSALKKSLAVLQKSSNFSSSIRPSTPSFPLLPKSPQLPSPAKPFFRLTKEQSLSPVSFTWRTRPKLHSSKVKAKLGRRVSDGRTTLPPTERHLSLKTRDIERKVSQVIEELELLKHKARTDCRLNSMPIVSHSERHAEKQMLRRRRKQSVVLQALLRGYLARRQHTLYLKSALTIQRWTRSSQVRHLYLNIRSAIICIQRAWRCNQAKVRSQSKGL